MAAVLLAATAGMAWADAAGDGSKNLNPQPLPPGAKQQATGDTAGNGADDLNPQPYPPKGKPGNADTDPKVGKETLVNFEEGNPDKPIVAGQEGKGIYYYFNHGDSGHKLITGQGNNAGVTTSTKQTSINAKGAKSHTKGSIVVMEKDGKKDAKSPNASISNGTKGQFTGGIKNSFQKANTALNGTPHNGAMGDGSVRGQ